MAAQNKHLHLTMIQGIIDRLGRNSFSLKGWSVVLVAALFALSANDSKIGFVYLAYFPAIVFWGLDGYFLRQERLFRALFNYVRELPEAQIDFSMDRSSITDEVVPWIRVVFSPTLLAFHGVIIISIIVVVVISAIWG